MPRADPDSIRTAARVNARPATAPSVQTKRPWPRKTAFRGDSGWACLRGARPPETGCGATHRIALARTPVAVPKLPPPCPQRR
eukprot:CAMPEP_0173390016 /NCGR_PEP_ID=MMETSP1356-20130122/14246_1 /TAXON_ID=77927 ORGANISM="Hemiselmis virescens, Strain PCC157" /NCGR_SAMPLE_ID=MMETSP1356 /ASSEMBLY_ACC=CAM_ASM_000847 /LENGTH=82 /DNA_ID=CAMNT_0014347321 /DNA_START=448 /DNA_END=693 /DNA_ORIENTATION=-